MLQALATAATKFVQDLSLAWRPVRRPTVSEPQPAPPSRSPLQPLRRVVLTDGVSRTLFEEYAEHQAGSRGEEETGWLILGHRQADEALVLATLPAGTQREAGVAHVRFNSLGQAVGYRIVRRQDPRLTLLGLVHTHPGSMRHPSDGDYRGDSRWVRQLRGKEGIFGIGTADAGSNGVVSAQPKPHVQTWGQLRLSWYVLGESDSRYRPVPVDLTLGPDLARPLHELWPTLETHAAALERLAVQQADIGFARVAGKHGPALSVTLPLAEPERALCLLLEGDTVSYLVERDGDLLAADVQEPRLDAGVYRLLAELAASS